MNQYYTFTVNDESYKLRLTASAIIQIEKKLGRSLFSALEHIQDNMIETVTTILWGALQPLNANMPMERALSLFDNYIDEGHSLEDLMLEINELFLISGFFKKGQEK